MIYSDGIVLHEYRERRLSPEGPILRKPERALYLKTVAAMFEAFLGALCFNVWRPLDLQGRPDHIFT